MAEPANLLIIHTDQQSAWTVGACGGDLVDTPNTDRIGREGAVFSNFFVNSALCTPSRGCLLTGRYPHCHGAWDNNLPLNRDEVTLAHVLARAGYETGYAGKWHLDGEGRPGWLSPERSMGFQDCRWMFNRGHYKRVLEAGAGRPEMGPLDAPGRYMTDWLTDKTVEFLGRPRTRPFFWMVSFPDPHTPFNVRRPYADLYDPADMPVPETFWQEDLPSWAEPVRAQFLADAESAGHSPEDWLRRRKAAYCGEVKCIDDGVGRILQCLTDGGLLDRTAVVFTTDHGEYMGEHGLYHKNYLYETAHRVPLLIRWPQAVRPGTVVDRFVTTVDFQQTILALLGLEPTGREQGRDASPWIAGRAVPWTHEAFIHHSSFDFAGVFTPEAELALARSGEHVLFDRMTDPDQVRNLASDPARRPVMEDLIRRVIEHNRELDSPAMEWLGGVSPGRL